MFNRLFEVIERFIDLAQGGEITGDVIQNDWIVRIEFEGAAQPALRSLGLSEHDQRAGTQMQATGIVGMPLEMPLQYLYGFPRLFDGKCFMPGPSQDLDPETA